LGRSNKYTAWDVLAVGEHFQCSVLNDLQSSFVIVVEVEAHVEIILFLGMMAIIFASISW